MFTLLMADSLIFRFSATVFKFISSILQNTFLFTFLVKHLTSSNDWQLRGGYHQAARKC